MHVRHSDRSMNNISPALEVTRKTGDEPFHTAGKPTEHRLLNFWQWSASDLASNAWRGLLAEFLVAQALGVSDGVRTEWDAVDIVLPSGRSIEVKSSAYVQTWAQ